MLLEKINEEQDVYSTENTCLNFTDTQQLHCCYFRFLVIINAADFVTKEMIYFFLSHNQLWLREECFPFLQRRRDFLSGALSIYIVLLLVCCHEFYTNTQYI